MNGNEELKAIREAIDRIDAHLIELLNKRMELALEAGRVKAAGGIPLFDSGREAEIYERLTEANPGPIADSSLRAIYREILSASRQVQEEKLLRDGK
ncbi:MAG: chorismate mutase [Syntrophobacteraceae bacterium]|nr:chorismate mutase [Desulfobacteraceae bacterium]